MAGAPPPGDFRVCIDIGGTFTDCVVAQDARGEPGSDADQSLRIFKTPSTPAAFEQGFMNALGLAAEGYGLELPDFVARVARIVHGTTVSTNALLEGKHAPVGLICTHGFRDILTLREAPRKPPFQWRLTYPEPFVPRIRTRGGARADRRRRRGAHAAGGGRRSRGGRGFSQARRGGGRGLPALVSGERQSREARGRDRAATPGPRSR